MYRCSRVFHQLADFGWVDLGWDVPQSWSVALPFAGHLCQNPIYLSKIGQIVEVPKSVSQTKVHELMEHPVVRKLVHSN